MSFVHRLRAVNGSIVDLAGTTWTNHGVTVDSNNVLKFVDNTYLSTTENNFQFGTGNFTAYIRFKKNKTTYPYSHAFGKPHLPGEYLNAHLSPTIWVSTSGLSVSAGIADGGEGQAFGSTAYAIGDWVTAAFVRKNDDFYFFVNGELKSTYTYTGGYSQDFSNVNGAAIGWDMRQSVTYMDADVLETCLIDDALWTADFTPPSGYLSINDVIYLSGQEAWGINSGGNFAKLSNNWSSESDANKIAILTATDGQVPTIANLKTLTMPIKAVNYVDESTQPACTMTAVPHPQTILPKGLINLAAYFSVTQVTVTSNISGNGAVKLAVTEDLTNYKVYDTVNSAWVAIDISDIATDGMTPAQVAAIPSSGWDLLTKQKLGFAYYLSMQSTTDQVATDDLTLDVIMQGEWISQVQGTVYDYSYPSNSVLQVKLYVSGDYKINYSVGGPAT